MYVAVCGNIGSGKTTLTGLLVDKLGARACYETEDNPYIGDFYGDMNRWAFNLQVYFLGSRIKQTIDLLRDGGDFVQDRTIYEDAYIFADNLHEMGLISSRDFDTYMKIFNLSTGLVRCPDVLVYLKASVPTLVSQILKRGRSYEMNIDSDYLDRLNRRYNDWIENIYTGPVLTVNVDETDFIMEPGVVDDIAARIVELANHK